MIARAKHTEIRFEDAIQVALLTHGYAKGNPVSFDAERALFPTDVIAYIRASQPKKYQSLVDLQGSAADATLLDALTKELAAKGMLFVLRHGFQMLWKNIPDGSL